MKYKKNKIKKPLYKKIITIIIFNDNELYIVYVHTHNIYLNTSPYDASRAE